MKKKYKNKMIGNEDFEEKKPKKKRLVEYSFPSLGRTVEAETLEEALKKINKK